MRRPTERKALNSWCQDNLSLNISKTKETIVDYRNQHRKEHWPIHISGVKVESVSSFMFLGMNITEDLSWILHKATVVRNTCQCLYFLKSLRKFDRNSSISSNFYRITIENLV